MLELWNTVTIFILALLGLIAVAVLIVFVWLAYRYDIRFSISTKEGGQWSDETKWGKDNLNEQGS